MLRKLLIPLDGSVIAERAFVTGALIAQHAEASLELLSVVEPEKIIIPDAHVMGGYAPLWPNQSADLSRRTTSEYLKAMTEKRLPAGTPVHTGQVEGDPASVIVETAQASGCDLIVMSSHGYSGVTRWVLGSVAERVLHAAPCPVLVIRSADPIHHVLLPLDGSRLSEQILEPAFEIAGLMGCKVTLLRIIPPLSYKELQSLEGLEPGLGVSVLNDMETGAEQYLHGLAMAHRRNCPQIETAVNHGGPAQGILDYAAGHNVDLLAMSTHGRTGLRRWVYGSITEKVLHAAPARSMLVVRPPEGSLN
jgi:nucleotide-binding universal stress UspA family protein